MILALDSFRFVMPVRFFSRTCFVGACALFTARTRDSCVLNERPERLTPSDVMRRGPFDDGGLLERFASRSVHCCFGRRGAWRLAAIHSVRARVVVVRMIALLVMRTVRACSVLHTFHVRGEQSDCARLHTRLTVAFCSQDWLRPRYRAPVDNAKQY